MKYFLSMTGLMMAAFAAVLVLSQLDSSATEREPITIVRASNNAEPSKDDGSKIDPKHVMQTYCASCHGPEKQKGKVRFDQLNAMNFDDRMELLNLAHEAVHFQEMPPSDKPQPSKAERKALLEYLSGQSGEKATAALQDKLRYPGYGNLVDHEALFSGEIDGPAFTYERRWLVSPQIFLNRALDMFELEGSQREQAVGRKLIKGLSNPFVLPDTSGVQDYATRMLTGGHLITMLGNAEWIAHKQVFATKNSGKKRDDIVFPYPQDTWYPGNFAPPSFKAILDAPGKPSDDQIKAAITKQFDLALRRPPTSKETDKYLAFTRSMIEKGGNEQGLKQLLKAVVLESDFVYRVEFGGGEVDEFGRRKLTPREAAHAIAYALGDLKPDASLLAAAEEGRLSTKEDYRREAERLLADQTHFYGPTDPRISGSIENVPKASHPKIVRFFRDFFGYPMAMGIFKDPERVEGNYFNLGRSSSGTSGALVREADQFVIWHLGNDRDVFENLLTSDQYFVYYRGKDREAEQHATIAEYRQVWERLKDTPWESDPKNVYAEHEAFLKSKKLLKFKDNRRQPGHRTLVYTMRYFSQYFPHGRTPFPKFPWAHGNQNHHASLYSLPSTPGGYYYSKGWAKLGEEERTRKGWDYPIEQPFSIPNRKGILSHPAWLIAHAHNFQTDPIKRGLWIQEKLLANRVPDVPITVDAKIPDHPDKTLRTRLTEKTTADECWRCHKHMNPLGLPFEMYDDFGRFRTEEAVEYPENILKQGDGKNTFNVYKTLPIDTTGTLIGTDVPSLDGEVEDALDLIDRLSKSDRVRQSIIRHAFRFFMGRNEMLSDSKTLIDMDKAYLESGGSFNAVIVILLTSDSFMYRKEVKD